MTNSTWVRVLSITIVKSFQNLCPSLCIYICLFLPPARWLLTRLVSGEALKPDQTQGMIYDYRLFGLFRFILNLPHPLHPPPLRQRGEKRASLFMSHLS